MISPRRMSLRTQVVLASGALMVLLTGILASAMETRFAHRMEIEIGRFLVDVSHQVALILQRQIDFHGRQIATTASAVSNSPDNLPAVAHVLNDTALVYPDFNWLAYIRPDGVVAVATEPQLVGVDLSAQALFRDGREAPFIGDLHRSSRIGDPLRRPTPALEIAFPVLDQDLSPHGVLAANMRWKWAEDLVAATSTTFDNQGGMEVFVAAPSGRLLLAPPRWLGDSLPLHMLSPPGTAEQRWTSLAWPGGGIYLTAWATVGEPAKDWVVLTRQPIAAAYAPVRDLTRDVWFYGMLLAALFAWLSWLAAHRLAAPLGRIADAADRIRTGEPVDIPKEGGSREVASLSASLRALVHSLTDHEVRLGHMQRLAHQDPLTGLLNRAGFRDRLATMLRKARRRGDSLACLYLDLDGFKPINDSLGHAAGDRVLREVARRLTNVLREGDEVARLGGDEFAILTRVHPTIAEEQARIVADRALHALSSPVALNGQRAQVGCSIGIALWPQDSENFQEVRKMADEALYDAKTAGKNRAHFHHRNGQPPVHRSDSGENGESGANDGRGDGGNTISHSQTSKKGGP